MIKGIQTSKVINVTPPAAIVDNAAFPTAEVDTLGFRRAVFLVSLGALDIAVAAFKLRETNTSGSGYTDVPGADFSVLPATLPTATDDNKIYAIYVDMRGRKRYLDLSLTGGDGTAGTFAHVLCVLEEPEISPSTATARGIAAELSV